MTPRTRRYVLAVSIPVIAFAVIGGFLGQAMTRDDAYKHLSVFEDVVSIVLNNYVEEVDPSKAMRGALHGLADSLDADSAYLPAALAKSVAANENPGAGDLGVELIRQFYLRVISVRDGSPAARAGIRIGDYIRAINDRATRNMSALEGMRLLHGAPGSKVSLVVIRGGNTTDPHMLDLVRERPAGADITSRTAAPGVGYIRIIDFTPQAVSGLKQAIERLGKAGVTKYVIDLRGSARGDLDEGIAAARLFIKSGTITIRQSKNDQRELVVAAPNDGTITAPLALLTNGGTSGAAEVFAAALEAKDRATLVGEHTLGRTARQRLVKLADGSALWLTYVRYLTPSGDALHEKGLKPDIEVDEPDVEFGATPPAGDPTLDQALAHLTQKKAA
jgi:carboxyl-terminal processing protease